MAYLCINIQSSRAVALTSLPTVALLRILFLFPTPVPSLLQVALSLKPLPHPRACNYSVWHWQCNLQGRVGVWTPGMDLP